MMPRRPRQPKGSKDPVTGLKLVLKDADLTIESDRLYGKDTQLYKSFAEYSPDIVSGNVEFELGKEYIIITSTQQRIEDSRPWTTRQVLEGVFGYKKGVMISASVRSHATVNNEVSGSEMGDI